MNSQVRAGITATVAQSFLPPNPTPTVTSSPIISVPVTNPSTPYPLPSPLPANQFIPQPPQSYVPSAPAQPAPLPAIIPVPTVIPPGPGSQNDCATLANTYWTGYRCACRVGYALNAGICVQSQLSGMVFRPA